MSTFRKKKTSEHATGSSRASSECTCHVQVSRKPDLKLFERPGIQPGMMHAIKRLGERPMTEPRRCAWAESDLLLREYHDKEWGVPQHDSRALWELLMLEGFQAGLAWITVLRKRDAFRKAFHHFDPKRVAAYAKADITRLLNNPGIIRSRAKIEATIAGAHIYEEMRLSGEDFSSFVWKLAGGKPIKNKTGHVPAKTELSEEISAELKKRGFKFVGPVIVYAWMQAAGIVNDHDPRCFRRNLSK